MSPGSKWSTRYGTQYRRLCARPGCSAPAVATLRFQSTERLAWLVELDDNSARTQGDLCSRHAAALVLPRGWELRDERAARPGANPEPAAAASAVGSVGRARSRRNVAGKGAQASRLPDIDPPASDASEIEPHLESPDPEVDPETAADVAAEDPASGSSSEGGARGVPAQFGTNDDIDEVDDQLDEILDARTPLLRRAFRNAKPN